MDVVNDPIYNKDSGKADVKVVVLHHTAGRSQGDLATLWGDAEVSIHAYITKQGRIYLGVPFGRAAWHCGNSRWNGLAGINAYSIGIEIENLGDSLDPYTQEQLEALDFCLTVLIRPEFGNLPITRHRDISLEGKIDPSNNFPWLNYMNGIEQVTKRMAVTGQDFNEEDEVAINRAYPQLFPIDRGQSAIFMYDQVSDVIKDSQVHVMLERAAQVKVFMNGSMIWDKLTQPYSAECNLDFDKMDFKNPPMRGQMRVEVLATGGNPVAAGPGGVVIETMTRT